MRFLRIIQLVIIALPFVPLNAQHNHYFSECDWDKIVLDKNYVPASTDTCIVFASTRSCEESEKMFFGYDCDKKITIHYFNIYFKGNKWVAVPKKNLSQCLEARTDLQSVVFVEGFGRTFLTALDRATLFTRQYGHQVIMFDWPTYRPQIKAGKNYKMTVKESEILSEYFAKFLDTLDVYKSGHPVTFKSLSLIMHSMGNLLMMHAVKKNYLHVKDTLFNSIILNSACVPQRKHKYWVEKITIQKHLYITRNNSDRTLNGAKIISGFKKQLGERPRKPYANNAVYLDFSRVLEREHNYFIYPSVLREHPYIKDLYNTIFIGVEPDFNNETHFIKKPKKHAIELFDLQEAQKGSIGISIGG